MPVHCFPETVPLKHTLQQPKNGYGFTTLAGTALGGECRGCTLAHRLVTAAGGSSPPESIEGRRRAPCRRKVLCPNGAEPSTAWSLGNGGDVLQRGLYTAVGLAWGEHTWRCDVTRYDSDQAKRGCRHQRHTQHHTKGCSCNSPVHSGAKPDLGDNTPSRFCIGK